MTAPEDHKSDDGALAGEYALGLLTADEAQAFEARLEREPALRALYAEWAEELAAMTSGLPQEEPSPDIFVALEQNLFDERRLPLWRRLKIVESFVLAGAAALFAYVAVNFGWFDPAEPTLRAAIVAEDNSLVVNARYDMASQTLQLTRVKGAAAQGRSHALWLVAGRNAPVSLGVLSQEAETVVLVPAEFITSLSSAILVISDEPLGGSPTGAATGPVLAVGPITGT